jgi:hypothetical protein
MIPFSAHQDMNEVARRLVWFEPPDKALANPARFLAYAMTYGTHDDMKIIRRHVSDSALREALTQAPAGVFDPRSWAYWHVRLGCTDVPPLPERRIP